MGVILGMFRELARLGVTRAAAFFYAVAVGVVANVIIAHFSPHSGDQPTAVDLQPAVSHSVPVATAVIAPKPAAPPVQTIDVSAPATPPAPKPASPPTPDASASLPSPAAMTPPPLKPA